MKRFLLGLSAAALAFAVTVPASACMGEHGYTKTADAVQQSTMSVDKKAALMKMINKSKAAHDKFTTMGEYGKMSEAVQELDEVKRQLGN